MSSPPDSADVARIERILGRMRAIGAELDPVDGVAVFNRMYLAVTEAVRERLDAGAFRDGRFLGRLTAVFAELYLDAYGGGQASPPDPPKAWAPLFEARRRQGTIAVQFAVAGMNSHINYDLGVAVAGTCRQLRLSPQSGSPQHADYLLMNSVLAEIAEDVKADLGQGLVGLADAALGRLDDVVGSWSIARARDAAWTSAETLHALEPVPPVRDRYLLALARSVGLTGRMLLVPVL